MSDVTIIRDGRVARVVLGTGRRSNALRSDDWAELAAGIDALATDESLRVVTVTGAGRAAFSAGSDMREWVSADPRQVENSFARMEAAFTAIERLPVPVIAGVRGVAAGAGCQLACACDLRVIGERSRMGMPIARWGILASPAFAARIALLSSPDVARDLLYTGRLVEGPEAVRLGLASRCVPDSEVEAATEALVQLIAAQPAGAIRAAKLAVEAALAPTRTAVRTHATGPAADYGDLQRGITAFLQPTG
ncbi:MAG TPA: enoyl-CoA hydratase/isomerase family protein [Streptosporangiaceae bacterium]|jgi:enoyl-CoA hydratase/carnithine racemase|nr:enoyl-CoA hydratase/isomerase family protein [Streptosporangiaceae bacterium]